MPEDRSKRRLLSIVNPKRRSISRELTVGLIVTIAVVSAITMCLSYFNASRRAKVELENKASEYVVSLTDILGIPLWNFDEKSIEGIGRSYAQNEFVQGLRIIDSWGKVYFQTKKEGEVPLVHKTSDIFHEGESVGHVELSLTSGYYKEVSRQLLWSSSFTIIIALISLIIMTGFLLRILLKKPLDSLNEIVDSYASGVYDRSGQRIPYLEFQPLGDVLTQMGDKIKSQMTELRKHRDHLEGLVEERTAELQAVNEELEAFSYSVSHDLRAPLRAIDGFSKMLLKEYSANLEKEGKHYLQRVGAGVQNMSQLIDDLLNLFRIGRHSMTKKKTNLETIVKGAYNLLEDEWRKRKVNFTVHQLPSFFADPHLMQIVFTNLLSNSLKFTRSRATAEIEVGCETKDKQTIFFVKDNGVGFDMKYADKLFTPLQRLHPQEEYEGTGVGLATVRRIIQRHGGRIWVESKPGSGTTIYFTLEGDKSGSQKV